MPLRSIQRPCLSLVRMTAYRSIRPLLALSAGLAFLVVGGAIVAWSADAPSRNHANVPSLPHDQPLGHMELVTTFADAMPTGVTVSHAGRIFVNFPRWGDDVPFTVAELKHGRPVAYPDAGLNRLNVDRPSKCLVSVQSVVVDPNDRLWILDTGSIEFKPVLPGGPKLVGVDLTSNKVFKTISFPRNVALATTYLNDIRFDLRRGREGMAFITDSAGKGANAIIVVDLASGKSWRRLNNHPSTKAVPQFLPIVEGRPLMNRPPRQPPSHLSMGADGIAIGHDGKRLFYCPLCSRRLYSVSVDALINRKMSEEQVAATVEDHGDKGASDGLESDAEGRVYVTDYETNGIMRRLPSGSYEPLVHDPRILWPDTLSLATDGYLYFTDNQLPRMPRFHHGQDRRQKPYSLWRIKVDARPVLLK